MELKLETENRHLKNCTLVMDLAKPEEIEDIFQFIMKHHFTLPPIRQIMFFDGSSDDVKAADLFDTTRRRLHQPYSVVMRDCEAENRIIGTSLNLLQNRDENPATMSGPDPNDRSAGWLRRAIVAELYKGVDLYDGFDTEKILDLGSGVVDPIYRRLGLLFRMQNLIVHIAQAESGVRAVKGQSLREVGFRYTTETLGLQVIRTVEYATFEFPPGVKVMTNIKCLGDSRFARLTTGQLPLAAFASL